MHEQVFDETCQRECCGIPKDGQVSHPSWGVLHVAVVMSMADKTCIGFGKYDPLFALMETVHFHYVTFGENGLDTTSATYSWTRSNYYISQSFSTKSNIPWCPLVS